MVKMDLSGKVAVVAGVANKYSIAWAVARRLHEAGAELVLTYQNEKLKRRVEEIAGEVGEPLLVECDVTNEDAVKNLFEKVKSEKGQVYTLIHSIAFAPREELGGSFLNTSRHGFAQALDISAYSLILMSHHAVQIMEEGGSVLTMTYMASERVVPGYNVMGVAKAALESIVRYLAWELGEQKGIRVNAISAGPLNTLAARGIKGFSRILDVYPQRAPLKRNITHEEVASAALFLVTPLASGITGEILFVDAGYHIMGL